MQDHALADQAEYVLPDDEVIITHTDASSHITYANSAFLKSSEFTIEECLGQPQNIVRHPDMPREVFADLWATIRSGEPWVGIVKNRRKHGGFYWVRANITPIMEKGAIVGYLSVRVKPTNEEVRGAQEFYSRLRSGRAGSRALRSGKIVDTSFIGGWRRRCRPTLGGGAWLVLGALFALFAAVVAASLGGQSGLAAAAGLGGMLLVVANLLYIQRSIVRPLRLMHSIAIRIIGGDTACRFPEAGDGELDRLAKILNQVCIKIDGVLKDTQHEIGSMRGGAAEVVDANTNLSHRTSVHAANIEETASSLGQLTAAVNRNTLSAHQATKLALDASQATVRGRDVVGQVVSTMNGISSASRKINDIVGIIDDLAFQTNLLALNAAVEAARAGEQGRGFAVVAQEVRHLAQRSATAAKEIGSLISASGETVQSGTKLANQAEAAMSEVVSSVAQVTDVIAQIDASSREQASGIEQINRSMAHMDEITQQDAQMAGSLLETAQRLEQQSNQVLTAVSAFSLLAAAGQSPSASTPAAMHRASRNPGVKHRRAA